MMVKKKRAQLSNLLLEQQGYHLPRWEDRKEEIICAKGLEFQFRKLKCLRQLRKFTGMRHNTSS
jgi:hypothetical protein